MTIKKDYLKKILAIKREIEQMTLTHDLSREQVIDDVIDALDMHPTPGQGMTEIYAGIYQTQYYTSGGNRRITIPTAAPDAHAYTLLITEDGVLRYVPLASYQTLSPIIEVD